MFHWMIHSLQQIPLKQSALTALVTSFSLWAARVGFQCKLVVAEHSQDSSVDSQKYFRTLALDKKNISSSSWKDQTMLGKLIFGTLFLSSGDISINYRSWRHSTSVIMSWRRSTGWRDMFVSPEVFTNWTESMGKVCWRWWRRRGEWMMMEAVSPALTEPVSLT